MGISYHSKTPVPFPHTGPPTYFLQLTTLSVTFPKLSYGVRQILPRTLLSVTQKKHRGSSDGKNFAAIVYGGTYREEAKITLGESQIFQETENSKR